jgi:hypothetical protein
MRTSLQKRLLLEIETSFKVLVENFHGNHREIAALNKIRDALYVLTDPNIINKDDPPDEPLLVERLLEMSGNIKTIAVYATESMPEKDLYFSLITMCHALNNNDLIEKLDAKQKQAIDKYRKTLLGDYTPGRKVIPFPSDYVSEVDS